MIGSIAAVLGKELVDHSRDRRSMLTMLLFPLLGPVLFAGMFTMLASWTREDRPLEIAIVGAERAPNLVAFLERAGAQLEPAPADYEQKVQDGELDVVMVIPEGYGEDFTSGRPAKVELVVDNSRNQARVPIRRAHRLLAAYSATIAQLRLLARGISPELAAPVTVDEVDLATTEKKAANVLNMIPLFLLMATLMGGMHLAIDATAGERERGSLEPLLLNPVTRTALVAGKWIATLVGTWITVVLTLLFFKVAISFVPLEDLGVKAELGAGQFAGILLVILPLSLLAAAAQILISTFARSFKEAQQYVQLLVLVPLVPAMFMSLSPIKPQPWMMAVPFLGQDLLVAQVMRGEAVDALSVALSVVGTVIAAAACLAAAVRLLGHERIVFGR